MIVPKNPYKIEGNNSRLKKYEIITVQTTFSGLDIESGVGCLLVNHLQDCLEALPGPALEGVWVLSLSVPVIEDVQCLLPSHWGMDLFGELPQNVVGVGINFARNV